MPQPRTPSRRATSRVPAHDSVWVYWNCGGPEDLSRIRDLSVGGLFLETSKARPPGTKARLHFLVQEGQIRAEGEVRHSTPGRGLGLKFTALNEEDRPKLTALMTRLRGMARGQA